MSKALLVLFLFLSSFILCSCGSTPRTTLAGMMDTLPHPTLTSVDHSLFTAVLADAVSEEGEINVERLKGDESLTAYLEQLANARLDVFPSRNAQLTFWINAYNAYVLDMLRLNPVRRSSAEIGRLESASIAIVGGKRTSLSDIKANLTKEYREPRMYFSMTTGDRSEPRFWQEAYMEDRLSDQLDRAVRWYFADSLTSRLDKNQNTIYLSNFVQENREHFIRAAGTLVGFIRAFAPPQMGEHIDQRPTVKVLFMRDDNTLRSWR